MRSDPTLRNPSRRFDQTQCHERTYTHQTHRDYLAHCFRWGWAARLIGSSHAKSVLDIGCGEEFPLVKELVANFWPGAYVGVDYNKLPKKPGNNWIEAVHGEFDFTTRYPELVNAELAPFDVIVCFEVIEHMRPEDGARLLKGVWHCLKPDTGRALISTPVYDGHHAAANHLHEYTIPELQAAMTNAGLETVQRFGTFASVNPLRKALQESGTIGLEHRAVWERVREFYGDDVAACFLAPLYPDASRNNAWILRRPA